MKYCFILFSCFFFLHSAHGKTARKLILTIGISHFKDKSYHKLEYASKDGKKLSQFLKKSWKDISFKRNLSSTPKKKISKAIILNSLREIESANFSKEDIVIIYISTHGTLAKNKTTGKLEKYLVTSLTKSKDITCTGLPFKTLKKIFHRLKSQKKALILDSCFSGTGKSVFSQAVKKEIQKYKGVLPLYREFNVA